MSVLSGLLLLGREAALQHGELDSADFCVDIILQVNGDPVSIEFGVEHCIGRVGGHPAAPHVHPSRPARCRIDQLAHRAQVILPKL